MRDILFWFNFLSIEIIRKDLSLWRTALGDAVLERSIENRCIKSSKVPETQNANLGSKQVVSPFPHSLLSVAGILQFPFARYFTWIPWIFRCVSQLIRESNGIGFRVVMRITSHNYDVTNVCPDSIACAWQPSAWSPTTPFEIKYVGQT